MRHPHVARRQMLKGTGVLGIAGVLAALEGAPPAQAREHAAGMPGLVGTWTVHSTDKHGPQRIELTSYTKDGIVLSTGGLLLKASPQAQPEHLTSAQGAWAAAGDGFDATFVQLNAGADGSFTGTVTLASHIVLDAGGESWQGTYTVTVMAQGKVVFTSSGTHRATRVHATPAKM